MINVVQSNEQTLMEDSVQIATDGEKALIDRIIDNGAQKAGTVNYNDLHSLYGYSSWKTNFWWWIDHNVVLLFRKGLLYLEVPIESSDYISVPPLEGFVMNRVLGDYFETLLYKIFVSVDEKTSVGEVKHHLIASTSPCLSLL